jgi:type I restriction enzyme S subunit
LVPTEAALARAEKRDYETADVLLKRILAERRRRWEEAELAKMIAAGKPPKDDSWKRRYEAPAAPDVRKLPSLPDGWCWSAVGQLAEVSGGLTKNPSRDQLKRQLPYLRVANVYANRLELTDVRQIGVLDAELSNLLLRSGDLLVVEGNGSVDQIGRVALWDASIDPVVHQNHIIKARFIQSPIERWALTWLSSRVGRSFVEATASSTSGLHTLSISKVQRLVVPLPPMREQERILECLDELTSGVHAVEHSVGDNRRRCARLRQSVLKWSFEGKLVDQNASDEPADQLLAKLRDNPDAMNSETAAAKRMRGRRYSQGQGAGT